MNYSSPWMALQRALLSALPSKAELLPIVKRRQFRNKTPLARRWLAQTDVLDASR